MANVESILPSEMYGLMFISGYRGVGKSWLAASADRPENIAFYDFEEKGRTIDTQLEFGLYRALTVEAALEGATRADPLRLFDASMEAFTKLEKDAYTVAVLDNVSTLELAIQADARRNLNYYCERFGLSKANVLAGRFGGVKSVVNYFIGDLSNILHSRGVRLVVAISHISDRWSPGGKISGKYNVKGADRWQELSILTLLLIPGDFPPNPTALVQKESLGSIGIKKDLTTEEIEAMRKGELGHDMARRLPFRIPRCTFQEIRRYLVQPADINNPAEGEVPKGTEAEQFDAKLTKEQMHFVMMAMAAEERKERESKAVLTEFVNASAEPAADVRQHNEIAALLAVGKSPAEVMAETGATLLEVLKVQGEMAE